jgi:hypothetical protein
MISEKDKLAAKSVDQLKAAAKRLGGKLVTPDGKAKTKQQLINTIVMKNRLAGKSMGAKQTGTSNKAKDLQRKAKAPGKRTSAKGKVYTETRKNRSDKPGTLLGQKNTIDRNLVEEVIIFAENDSKLYNDLMVNYLPNLQKKVLAGKYDPELAIKLLEYYYTNYVRPYMKMPRNYGVDTKLNPEERKAFAKYFRDKLFNEYGLKQLAKKPKGAAKDTSAVKKIKNTKA